MITEESFVDFKCPYCGEAISFPQENAGQPQPCPNCTETVIVPREGEEGGKLPLPLTTEHLILDRFTGADWQDLLECLSQEEVYRHMEGTPVEEEQVLHWLEQDSRVKLTTPGSTFNLGLHLREGGKLIGYLGLAFELPFQAALQVVINPSHQRQGLAREAVAAALNFCFAGLHLHRVTASCNGLNEAACKLFARAGLRREGEFLRSRLFNGEWTDLVVYAILAEEYAPAP